MTKRADVFRYVALDVSDTTLRGVYALDDQEFIESVSFDDVPSLQSPAARSLAELWFLLAGLSYYKAGAARSIDVSSVPMGPRSHDLFRHALLDGLGEFAFRNQLSLDDVAITSGAPLRPEVVALDGHRVLIPFGGGIDSVVTTTHLSPAVDKTLFIVSPASGRFRPLEDTAAVTTLGVVRATRSLDAQLLTRKDEFFQGHVPVTAMVTVLAAIAALATGRGGVVMSNEHSASVPNISVDGHDINHQWSKSLAAEVLLADAIDERVGPALCVASFLRNRSELWVAREFSNETSYHPVFRSCNRAFRHDASQRAATWCNECDKCLFVNLVLAPFIARGALRDIFSGEPLSDPARDEQLRVLVGAGAIHKPFECVGDPDESAAALVHVAALSEWSDQVSLQRLAHDINVARDLNELMESQGPTRVPAHWLR